MNQNYAGFWIRFMATLLDGVILLVASMVMGAVLGLVTGNSAQTLNSILGLLISIGYYVFYQASAGQTLGKKVMKIKVVNEQGATPTVFIFFLREIIGKFISSIILGIGYLMVIWDGKKQGLHDKIAGTFVVKV